MNRAALAARLEKLEARARRSTFPAEREVALAKANSLRATLGMRPIRVKSKSAPVMPPPPDFEPGRFMTQDEIQKMAHTMPPGGIKRRVFRGAEYEHVNSSTAKRYYVDVSDTNSIGDALRKAFKVAFEDVKAEHRKTAKWNR
jgi:hypothetical protein